AVETEITAHWDSVAALIVDGNNDETPSGSLTIPHQDFSVGQTSSAGWPGHTSFVSWNGGVGTHVSPAAGLERATSGASDISYEFSIPLDEIERHEIDYLEHTLTLQHREGRTYNFTDDQDTADALFVFHRDVEQARERLSASEPQ
ncbi:MAG: hypothetical protein CL477_06385, partial [Acidobacteria bacterium]|nr:hypothetical protein [Acidobacteriota bacterium]